MPSDFKRGPVGGLNEDQVEALLGRLLLASMFAGVSGTTKRNVNTGKSDDVFQIPEGYVPPAVREREKRFPDYQFGEGAGHNGSADRMERQSQKRWDALGRIAAVEENGLSDLAGYGDPNVDDFGN